MKVHVEHRFEMAAIALTIYEQTPAGTVVYELADADEPRGTRWGPLRLVPRDLPPDATAPPTPTLILDERLFEQIVKAGTGIVPASEATHDALVDTRQVRDRLLGLVERLTTHMTMREPS